MAYYPEMPTDQFLALLCTLDDPSDGAKLHREMRRINPKVCLGCNDAHPTVSMGSDGSGYTCNACGAVCHPNFVDLPAPNYDNDPAKERAEGEPFRWNLRESLPDLYSLKTTPGQDSQRNRAEQTMLHLEDFLARTVLTRDEMLAAQGRVIQLFAKMDRDTVLSAVVGSGNASFWAILLARDTMARRSGGFRVASWKEAQLWTVKGLHTHLVHSHGRRCSMPDSGISHALASAIGRVATRTLQVHSLGPLGDQEVKLACLGTLLARTKTPLVVDHLAPPTFSELVAPIAPVAKSTGPTLDPVHGVAHLGLTPLKPTKLAKSIGKTRRKISRDDWWRERRQAQEDFLWNTMSPPDSPSTVA